jgi:flagellum-specific ATP synthase
MDFLEKARSRVRELESRKIVGSVVSVGGMDLMCGGLSGSARLGDHVLVADEIRGEIVGIQDDRVRILPFGGWEGVSAGDDVMLLGRSGAVHPGDDWLGRVIDAFGNPLDGKDLSSGRISYKYRASPPDAFDRRSVGSRLETGVKSIDVFVPLCRGQRLGVFAGSGVGKSTLLGMFARQVDADVIVLGLIGERGREVHEFIEKDLGPEGMARSVLVVATSDQPPLVRRQAAWTATAVAEYFRDQGKHVLLMLDSVTRFAMAQREIGLAAGEPPTSKGYTPTVFSELPKLMERSGPGSTEKSQGDITAIYTVLVDGDDMNEPIADAVRGILDGHLILDRKIAELGRYPAVNVQSSVSRMLPGCHAQAELSIMQSARVALARHSEMEDLIRIGAYRKGSDRETDKSVFFAERAEAFLRQGKTEALSSVESFAALYGLLTESGFEVALEDQGDSTNSEVRA